MNAIPERREIYPEEMEFSSAKQSCGRVYITRGARVCVYCEGEHNSTDCVNIKSVGERKKILLEKSCASTARAV